MVAEYFQSFRVHINGKCILQVKKLNADIFTHSTQAKLSPVSYHHSEGRRKVPSRYRAF